MARRSVPVGGLLNGKKVKCSSVDAAGRGCSVMFAWYHRLVPRLAGYPQREIEGARF